MKPVLLEIEGFNSFEEKQTIDFEKLTEYGLFGIFGKTGSGKTSILDAIIYALYGDMPRGSKNLVNINSKRATVRYIFTIKGSKAGKYEVSRSVEKKESDDQMILGSANKNKKVLLKKYDENGETVLADSITGVDQAIKEIIGIKYEDFIKTVVLPQGQFSEFLKEKNKERKNILERIFGLNKYGDQLDEKVKAYKEKYVIKERELNASIATKKEVDQTKIENSRKDIQSLEKVIEKRKNARERLDRIKAKKEENERAKRDVQIAKEELEKVLECSDRAEKDRERLKKLKKLTPLQESIKDYQTSKEEVKRLEDEKLQSEKNLEEKSIYIEKLSKALEDIKEDIEKLPEVKSKMDDVKQAIESGKKIEDLDKQRNNIKRIYSVNQKLKDKLKQEIEELYKSREAHDKEVKKFEKESSELVCDPKYKQDVLKANEISESLIDKKNAHRDLREELEGYEKERQSAISKKEKYSKRLIELQEILESERNSIYKEEINNSRERENIIYNERAKTVAIAVKNMDEILPEIQNNKKKMEDLKEKIFEIENNIKILSEKKEKNLNLRVISNLRKTLKEGDTCPVCKNTFHVNIDDIEDIKLEDIDDEDYENLQKEKSNLMIDISVLDEKTKSLEKAVENLKENLKNITAEISDISGEKVNPDDIEKFISKKIDENRKYFSEYKIHTSIKEKAEYEKNEIESNKKVVEKEIESIEKQMEKIQAQKNIHEEQIREIEGKLNEILEIVKLKQDDLFAEKKRIFDNESKLIVRDNLFAFMKSVAEKIQTDLDEKNKNILTLSESLSDDKNRVEKINSEINLEKAKIKDRELLDMAEEKLQEIYQKNLEFFETTEEKEKDIREKTEKTNSEIYQLKEKLAAINANYSANREKFERANENLNLFMQQEGYTSIDEIFAVNRHYADIEKIEDVIKRYESALGTKKAVFEEKEKMAEKIAEEIEKLTENIIYDTEKHRNLLEKLNSQMEELGKMKKILEDDIQTYNEIKDIKKEQRENDIVLSEIKEIEDLLRGKKFVQFLSKYQLSYVCSVASDMLENISSGRYRINIDDAGDFIITDNLNGGINRLPETLSGGETFLVSLALALSLSSQIQLNGNSPLEFFFLDEGFGTLDEQSLNQVLESLARLRNSNNMAIGIISHVREIQEFVPVKLEVLHSNDSGSKIKMMKS